MSSRIRVVAAIVVDPGGRVFAVRRPAAGRNALRWELPGGKVEPGECDAVALERELREELAVGGRVGAHFLSVPVDAPDGRALELVFYETELFGEPLLIEHIDAAWIEPATLAAYDWCQADRVCLDTWFAPARRELGVASHRAGATLAPPSAQTSSSV